MLRVGNDSARLAEGAGHERAKVILLPRIFSRKENRHKIVHDGHLGDRERQDALRNRVEQRRATMGPRPDPDPALEPQQTCEVSPEVVLGTYCGSDWSQPGPKVSQRLRVGSEDEEIVPDPI